MASYWHNNVQNTNRVNTAVSTVNIQRVTHLTRTYEPLYVWHQALTLVLSSTAKLSLSGSLEQHIERQRIREFLLVTFTGTWVRMMFMKLCLGYRIA